MKSIAYLAAFALLVLGISACSKEEEEPVLADPPATITTSINYTLNATPIELFHGLNEDGPDTTCHNCIPPVVFPYVIISFGMNASLNFQFHTARAQTANHNYANPNWEGLGAFGGEIAHVGELKGLAYVKSIPAVGWGYPAAMQKGHGYVVRYKRSSAYNLSNAEYRYARFYVEDWMTSATSGGVIGARLKYENNWKP